MWWSLGTGFWGVKWCEILRVEPWDKAAAFKKIRIPQVLLFTSFKSLFKGCLLKKSFWSIFLCAMIRCFFFHWLILFLTMVSMLIDWWTFIHLNAKFVFFFCFGILWEVNKRSWLFYQARVLFELPVEPKLYHHLSSSTLNPCADILHWARFPVFS